MQFELTNFCEIDKNAITSYCRIHNEAPDKNLGDISLINGSDIADCNVIVGGSPCFTKDVMVLATDGYKFLSDVKIGDKLLTHDKTYEAVTNILNQGTKPILKIKSQFFTDIETTDNHRFYACEEGKEPRWIEAGKLTHYDYLGCYIGDTNTHIDASDGELYAYGLYLRFGTDCKASSLTFKVPVEYMQEMNKKLHKYKLSTSLGLTNLDPLYAYFTIYFGKYDFLPNLMELSNEQLAVVWAGFSELLAENQRKILVKDLNVAYNMSYVYMRCHRMACAMQKTEKGYLLDWSAKVSNWHVEDNYIWFPFNVEKTHMKKSVFDLTVDEAHSFVVQHCAVHNCSQK